MGSRSNGFAFSWQSVTIGALVGVSATLLLMLFSALIMASVDISEGASAVISCVCLSLGALAGGFAAAKVNRQNGLLCGLASGAATFLVFLLVALIMGSSIGLGLVIRLILSALFGAAGGVAGINLKKKRRYV